MMRNTLPPLASNDLFGVALVKDADTETVEHQNETKSR